MRKLNVKQLKSNSEFNVVNNKPEYCVNNCRLASKSFGFVRDWVGKQPKLAFLGIIPTGTELVNGIWETDMYRYLLHTFIEPLGLTKENLVLANVLRCQPKDKDPKDDHAYPTAMLRKHCEITCRFHDLAFTQFAPDVFISTFDIYAIRKLDANKFLFQADVKKAIRFIDMGYKPCLLLGEEPLHLVAPHLGGVKTWRGHWWADSWRWTAGEAQSLPNETLIKSDVAVAKKFLLNTKKRQERQLELF